MFNESQIAREIEREMSAVLDGSQMKKLHDCLARVMGGNEIANPPSNDALLKDFLNAKSVEGCSSRTIQYYTATLEHFVSSLAVPLHAVGTSARQHSPRCLELLLMARGRGNHLQESGQAHQEDSLGGGSEARHHRRGDGGHQGLM